MTTHRRDLIWVALVAVGTFAVSAVLELFERFERFAQGLERWQVDEALFTLISLAMGLTWYAWRRRREALAALRLEQQAESRAAALLAQNRELSQQLIATQERERLELARELHDDMGQCCNAIRVESEIIARANAADLEVLRKGARRIGAMADDLDQRVHALLRRLRPADLDALGLVAALQSLCESWEGSTGVSCVLHPAGQFVDLPAGVDIAVYRVAQEGLSNVIRHARAESVRLTLDRLSRGDVRLVVQDDGCGFDTQAARRGLGLLGARERAAALGGTLAIESAPGRGTRIVLLLPATFQPSDGDKP